MDERRSGEDRRALDRITTDRRKPGRPSVPDHLKPATLHVKVSAELHERVCRAAVRRRVAVNAIIRGLIERAVQAGEI